MILNKNFLENKLKNEKGSITIFVITCMLLFLVVIVSIFIFYSNKVNEQQRSVKGIQDEYSTDNIDQVYNEETSGKVVDGVTIPDGFYYVGGNKASGLVISDQAGDDLDNSKHGNQFVWVPVNDYSKFVRQEGYRDGNSQSYLSSCGEADSTGANENAAGDKVEETRTTKQEAIDMYESVKTYGGFYIGRFETGKDETGKTVVRKGVTPYNNVPWSVTKSMPEDENIDGTENGAIEQARYFDTANGYTSLTSTLCYSVQWDAALNFIDSNYISNATNGMPNCAEDSYVRDSDGKGWYDQSNATNTGYYQIKNIYDLGGNVCEWTMELYNTRYRVVRGGSYRYSGFHYPSSYRDSNHLDYAGPFIGFRICLFINVPE